MELVELSSLEMFYYKKNLSKIMNKFSLSSFGALCIAFDNCDDLNKQLIKETFNINENKIKKVIIDYENINKKINNQIEIFFEKCIGNPQIKNHILEMVTNIKFYSQLFYYNDIKSILQNYTQDMECNFKNFLNNIENKIYKQGFIDLIDNAYKL